MNKKRYESLPVELRTIIDRESGEGLSRKYGEATDRATMNVIETWRKDSKRTVTTPTKDEEVSWNQQLAPVLAAWEKQSDRNRLLVAALREQLGRIRAGQ